MSSNTKTTTSKEEAKPTLLPKLRFPEFRGTEGWHRGRIADIALSESSSRALNKLSLQAEGYPVYGADGCVGFIDSFDQVDDYIAIVKDGSGVGRLALKKGKSSVLGTLAYVKCKQGSETRLTWLYYVLKSLDLRPFIKGSGIPHIYFSDFGTHEVLIPILPEQQKIAECLSSVDELIAAQARKVDALKTHKKGLMQQLFPREGETQPRLRFPEFQNAGEWELKRLGDFASFYKGKGITKAEIVINGRRLCIRYGELYTHYGEVIDDVFSRTDTADADLFLSRSNDIIIPGSGETKLDIAKASCVMHADVALGGDLNVIRTDHNGVFLSYFLNGPKKLEIAKVAQGDTVVHLYPSQLKELVIGLPSEPEQNMIASCLTSLDDLIASQTQRIEALRTHKKGLMQQLFPPPAE
jgi:type I restriction enzyme S subunit